MVSVGIGTSAFIADHFYIGQCELVYDTRRVLDNR
jgi:hypothetical protein